MKRTALLASIALTAGLAAPAFSQEIAGTTVSEEDWPAVVEYCDILGELTTPDASVNEPDSSLELSTTTIQLDTLTRDDCIAAGLVEGAPDAGSTPNPNIAEDNDDDSVIDQDSGGGDDVVDPDSGGGDEVIE